ncbi:MAG: glycosyltransferase family 39 protein [Chloroflexota bacterium]|nr:glycosyltransferase family 39 protein [Chloroflexota bacterium]
MSPKHRLWIDRIGLLFILTILAITFLRTNQYWARMLRHPYSVDYGEGPLLHQARVLLSGNTIYPVGWTDYPYTVSNYPPLYITALAMSSTMFKSELMAGRVVTLSAAIASVVFIGLIIHSLTQDLGASVIAALIFAASPIFVRWATLIRVDMLALALSLLAILIAVRFWSTTWSPWLVTLLVTAAFLTRQTTLLAATVAVFVWFLSHDGKKARAFLLIGGISVLGVFTGLNLVTRGGFFLHTIVANMNDYSLGRVLPMFTIFALTMPILIAIALSEIGGAVIAKRPVMMLPASYAVAAIGVGLAAGKIGAGYNYFLELSVVLALFCGTVLARWRASGQKTLPALYLLLAVQSVILVSTNYTLFYSTGLDDSARIQLDKLAGLIEAETEPVLADEHLAEVVLRQGQIVLQPFEMTQLSRQGVWDQTPLVEDIRTGKFGLILVSHPPSSHSSNAAQSTHWTQEMWTAIVEAYEPEGIWADATIYRPMAIDAQQ